MMRTILVHVPGLPWECLRRDDNTAWLPTLYGLLEEGLVATPTPVGPSPLADGVIVTGRRPGDSGLLTRQALRPDGFGQDLATNLCLRAPALWDYLDAARRSCALINWRATGFLRLNHGWVASDLFTEVRAADSAHWGIPPGALWPASLRDTLAELRLHPADLGREQLLPLLAELPDQIPRQQQARIVARILSENSTAHAVATHMLATQRPDCLLVRYPAMEQLAAISVLPDARRPGQGAAWGFLQLLDAFVTRLLQLADPDTVLMVTGGGEDQPWWLARGPGLARDRLLPADTRLYDVPVALLACMGLRAPAELPGRVPAGFFRTPLPGLHPAVVAPVDTPQGLPPPEAFAASLRARGQLAAPPTPEQARQRRRIRFQQAFLIGENARLEQHPLEAIQAFRKALAILPEDILARLRLCQCLLDTGDAAGAQDAFAQFPVHARDELAVRLLGAEIAMGRGDPDSALGHLDTQPEALAPTPQWRRRLADCYLRIAELFLAQGEAQKAAGCHVLAMALQRTDTADAHPA